MSDGRTWAVVPVKSLAEAKHRLASTLSPEMRRRLMVTMFWDVLATLREVDLLHPILVVTSDQLAAHIAEENGAMVLREVRDTGHSAAVGSGLALARSRRATRVLTLPADVPMVTAAEIRRVMDVEGEGVTVVPSSDGDGTNALLLAPPDALVPSFGAGSFVRHVDGARACGIRCRILHLPGLGTDIDLPRDLTSLMREKRNDPRYNFLSKQRDQLVGSPGRGLQR
jgi:2-phospho-L-lactate guanylyltransferase